MLESCELLLLTVLGKINQNDPLGQTSKLETLGTISQVSVVHFYAADSTWYWNPSYTHSVDVQYIKIE